MNVNEIVCLGVDGNIYFVKRYLEVVCDNRGIPVGYEQPTFPSVPLIARFFSVKELEEHPLRKAFFKMLAAKAHNIVEKQRSQDVTIEEARQMAEEALRISGMHKNEVDFALNAYWS